MTLQDQIFSELSLGERAFLEDMVGIDLLEQHAMMSQELEALLDIYADLQIVQIFDTRIFSETVLQINSPSVRLKSRVN